MFQAWEHRGLEAARFRTEALPSGCCLHGFHYLSEHKPEAIMIQG